MRVILLRREEAIKRELNITLKKMKQKQKKIKTKNRSCKTCVAMCLRASNYDKKQDFAGNCDMYMTLKPNFLTYQPAKVGEGFFDAIKWRKIMKELDEIESELEEIAQTNEIYQEEE